MGNNGVVDKNYSFGANRAWHVAGLVFAPPLLEELPPRPWTPRRFPALRRNPSVGVISPYKSQVKLLRESFAQALGEEGARMVDINTIDGFQGREKDIILFSCVR